MAFNSEMNMPIHACRAAEGWIPQLSKKNTHASLLLLLRPVVASIKRSMT